MRFNKTQISCPWSGGADVSSEPETPKEVLQRALKHCTNIIWVNPADKLFDSALQPDRHLMMTSVLLCLLPPGLISPAIFAWRPRPDMFSRDSRSLAEGIPGGNRLAGGNGQSPPPIAITPGPA